MSESSPLRYSDFVAPSVEKDLQELIVKLQSLDAEFGKTSINIKTNAKGLKTAFDSLVPSSKNYAQEVQRLTGKIDKLESANRKMTKSWMKVRLDLKKSQKELDATKKKLDGLTTSTKRAGDQVKKSSGAFSKGFKQIAGAVTAANIITGIFFKTVRLMKNAFVGGVNIMANFESQMAAVRAITGATGDDMRDLTQDAIRLGGATIFTATQVGALQIAYGKLGFATGEILAATEATLDLAAATDEELGSAAKVAGATLRAFQIPAYETARVVDVMAASFVTSALDMEKFRESMKFIAPVARKAGFSLEDTTAILSKLADTGLYGSLAGTSMRNILLKMSDATSDLSKYLGFTVNNMYDFIRAMRLMRDRGIDLGEALEITDRRAVTAIATLADLGDELENATIQMWKMAGAGKEMADIRMDTLKADVIIMKSAWEGMVLAINESTGATNIFRDVVHLLTGAIQKMKDLFTDSLIAMRVEYTKYANDQMRELQNSSRREVGEYKQKAAERLKILKDQYGNDKDYLEKMSKLIEEVQEFEKNNYKATLEKERADLEKNLKDKELLYEKSYDRVIELQNAINEYKGRFPTDKALSTFKKFIPDFIAVKDVQKELDALINSGVLEYKKQKQLLEGINKILGEMALSEANRLAITGSDGGQNWEEWKKIEKARISAMEDGVEKSIALKKFEYAKLKHDLNKYGLSTKSAYIQLEKDIAEIKKKEFIKGRTAIIKSMEEGLIKEIALEEWKWNQEIELARKYTDDITFLEKGRNDAIARLKAKYILDQINLVQSGNKTEQDLALDNLDATQYHNEAMLDIQIQSAIKSRDYSKYTAEQNKKFEQDLQDEKTRIVLEGEMERLQLQIMMAEDDAIRAKEQITSLEAVLSEGGLDKKQELGIKKEIADLIKILDDAGVLTDEFKTKLAELQNVGKKKTDKGGIIQQLFGIENSKDFDSFLKDLKKGAKKTADILEDIADSAVDAADRQVDASRSRVESLQRDLQTEQDLMLEGKASRYSIVKEELAQAKVAQKEAEENQKKALRVQMALDTAVQISSLVTASADIFKSAAATSGLLAPIVGGVSIAAMWAAFIAAKSKAVSISGFKEGVIDLKGEGTGTSDSIPARLSKGETVMTAGETKRFKPVFSAIRERDDVKALTEMAMLINPDMYKRMEGNITLDHDLNSVMGKYYGTKVEGNYRVERLSGNHIRRSRIR